MFAPWQSHSPVRITKSHITGKSFIQKQIVEYDIKSKYPEKYSTVDKIGIEKLLARKSCFVLN